MKTTLVSICIPTYNGEAYLEECIQSCLSQTFRDFELVICDDGSTDGTVALVEKFKDGRIRFFKNENNLGLVGNWNMCMERANGQWIKFVFQDDFLTPDCLEQFAKKMNPACQLLVCERNFLLPTNASHDVIDYYTKRVKTLVNTTDYRGEHYSAGLISKIAAENICLNFIGEPSLILFRKDLVSKLGFFNSALKQICDLEFALRIASQYGLTYIPQKLCTFRIHGQSTTTANVKDNYFDLHYMEPVLFSFLLLYSDEYRSLRSQLGFLHRLKLRIYFNVKTYRASQENKRDNWQHYLFSSEQKGFEEIYRHRNGSLITKVISVLLK